MNIETNDKSLVFRYYTYRYIKFKNMMNLCYLELGQEDILNYKILVKVGNFVNQKGTYYNM